MARDEPRKEYLCQKCTIKQTELEILKSLPAVVACVMWDVLNDSVTQRTIDLAMSATIEEWDRFQFLRIVGGGNPRFPRELARLARKDLEREWEDMR